MRFIYYKDDDLQGEYRWWMEDNKGNNIWNGQFDIINGDTLQERLAAAKVLSIYVKEKFDEDF